MSRFVVGNIFLLVSMACATAAHVMLKRLIDEFDGAAIGFDSLRAFLTVSRLSWLAVAGLLLVGGFLLWMACLVRLPLSYAYPVASASVLLVAVVSTAVLGETLTARMWIGTILVLAGVVLLRPASGG